MATDFRDMAARAKEAFEAREAKRSMDFDLGAKALRSYVLPVLNRAKAEFAEAGIQSSVVEENFDAKDDADPFVSFSCWFMWEDDECGGQWMVTRGETVCFSSGGGSIRAYVASRESKWHPGETLGTANAQVCEPLISAAIERALANYFDALATLGKKIREW